MTEMNDRDWMLLGAYLDDELGSKEQAELARRLEREPSLARVLNEMRGLKHDLGALRPTGDAANLRDAPIGRWRRRGAQVGGLTGRLAGGLGISLAAGLAAVALLGVDPFDRSPSASEIHASFLARETASLTEAPRAAALSPQAGLPDLELAGLALMAEREIGGIKAGHYVGRNGCRLTLFVADAPIHEDDPALMQVAWRDGATHHLMVARAMDPRRFASIAAYLRAGAGSRNAPVLAGRLKTARACG